MEILDGLKSLARERGLWNFWLTDSERGYGLSTVEYAYLAEEMGKVGIAAEVFNCNAPDTGNMEVLERYGTQEHKDRWLNDLLDGKIRSAYVMTEPNTASSDAAQLSFEAKKDGDEWVLNGEKWWISGSGDPRCALYIVMACSDPDAPKHSRHTMFVMDADTPGVEILRPMQVFGHDDAPHGHMHLRFTNVRLPASAVVLGEGRGFEVAQGRLGPGRIHHCMRAIGQAEKALEMMCKRGLAREAFGKKIIELGANYDIIANARMEIEMARLLCLKAAYMMDTAGVRAAQPWISKIKVVAPLMAGKVIDEAMQLHGAAGISQDTGFGPYVDPCAHPAVCRRPRRRPPPSSRAGRVKEIQQRKALGVVCPSVVSNVHPPSARLCEAADLPCMESDCFLCGTRGRLP